MPSGVSPCLSGWISWLVGLDKFDLRRDEEDYEERPVSVMSLGSPCDETGVMGAEDGKGAGEDEWCCVWWNGTGGGRGSYQPIPNPSACMSATVLKGDKGHN